MPQTNNSSNNNLSSSTNAPLLVNDNNVLLAAANKLCNLAKNSTSNLPLSTHSFRDADLTKPMEINKTQKFKGYFKSTNNINDNAINFNDEDDEINDKENALFWQNLNKIKIPFTNTITLGRKFKKNVLKLSIFNSFSINTNDSGKQSKNMKTPDSPSVDNKVEDSKLSYSPSMTQKLTAAKPPINLTKTKLLKKQKKMKELEKLGAKTSDKSKLFSSLNPIIYKTI